jgi:DNA end-binding protein Ku
VVDLMEALRGRDQGAEEVRQETAAGQKEMLMPIAGKKASKEAAAKKPAARSHRKSA